MVIPVAGPLYAYFLEIAKNDGPGIPLFPRAFELRSRKKSGLSNKFYRLMTRAGVVEPRTNKKKGAGRDSRAAEWRTWLSLLEALLHDGAEG